MWRQISDKLRDYPGRQKVARALVELGLSIKEDTAIYCGGIELSDVKIARYLGVDRRTVRETAELICSDPVLKPVFEKTRPAGPFLGDIARFLGYSVIEIYADPHTVGIIAQAAALVSQENIAIRQAVADDPDLTPDPKLTLVVEKQPSGTTLQRMLKIPGVVKISTY
ncbi:MAG: amino acid-binding protein [Candidatus Bathyarchaeia archaeon]|jgi:predicted regulator of amino acid metabolism with ACT domain